MYPEIIPSSNVDQLRTDKLVTYLMEIVCEAHNNGFLFIQSDQTRCTEPSVYEFLGIGIALLKCGLEPSVLALFLEHNFLRITRRSTLDDQSIFELCIIKAMIPLIHWFKIEEIINMQSQLCSASCRANYEYKLLELIKSVPK